MYSTSSIIGQKVNGLRKVIIFLPLRTVGQSPEPFQMQYQLQAAKPFVPLVFLQCLSNEPHWMIGLHFASGQSI